MRANESPVAFELRDGLLQDLIAVGMLVEGARNALRDGQSAENVDALLELASTTIQCDMTAVRGLIDRLRGAAAAA